MEQSGDSKNKKGDTVKYEIKYRAIAYDTDYILRAFGAFRNTREEAENDVEETMEVAFKLTGRPMIVYVDRCFVHPLFETVRRGLSIDMPKIDEYLEEQDQDN